MKDPERIWAETSHADMLFLTSQGERVVSAYRQAVRKDNPFAWDAARRQLQLFESLGFKAELAREIIDAVDALFPADNGAAVAETPTHLVVFAGHQIDEPGRALPRFPPHRESEARALIRESISSLMDDAHKFVGLASAAPGADLLFHEVCGDLGVASWICLPMPSSEFVSQVFGELDDWRNRYIDLKASGVNVLELSDRKGLPSWMQVAEPNAWERGNEWVLDMALASNSYKTTLVVLWDGNPQGKAKGGTAHMVELARQAPGVRIHRIDASTLTAAAESVD